MPFLLFCLLLAETIGFSQESDLEKHKLKGGVKSATIFSYTDDGETIRQKDSLIFDKKGNIVFRGNYPAYSRSYEYKYHIVYDPDSNLCRKISIPVETNRQFQPYYHRVLRTILWLRENGDTLKTDYCDSLGFFEMPFFPEFDHVKILYYKKLKTLGDIFNSTSIITCADNIDKKTICYYNEKGLLTRLDYIGASYEEKVNYLFCYNSNFQLTGRKRIYDDTILTHHTLYQYHENGNIKEIKRFAYDTCCLIIHRFDNKGKITEELWFDTEQKYTFSPKDNSLFRHSTHEYDTSGRIKKINTVNSIRDNLNYKSLYQYTDKNGSYYSYLLPPDNDTTNLVKNQYHYDDKGNLILSVIHHHHYHFTDKYQYEYDEKGNWTKQTRSITYNRANPNTTVQVVKRVIEYY
ncbi:MAG: hypothetical protein ACOZCO_02225 [Bacteroidota bacterium]